jgi:hypothetical protein
MPYLMISPHTVHTIIPGFVRAILPYDLLSSMLSPLSTHVFKSDLHVDLEFKNQEGCILSNQYRLKWFFMWFHEGVVHP